MKTTLILVLLLSLITIPGLAESADSADSADSATSADLAGSTGLVIGGGGPMPTLMFLNLEDLNGSITVAGYPQINQVLFANGGGGYIGQLDGLRIGGFGLSGDTVSNSGSRSVSFDLAYGGIMVEKAVSNDDEFTVVLGTLLGLGSLDLRFISDIPVSFEDAVANPFVSSMSKEFFAVQPYIAFESKPFSWMWARLQLGFLWTLADQWTFEDAEFAGPPRTLGGLTASLMLRFGGGGRFPLDNLEAAIEALDNLELDSDSNEPDHADAAEDAETE